MRERIDSERPNTLEAKHWIKWRVWADDSLFLSNNVINIILMLAKNIVGLMLTKDAWTLKQIVAASTTFEYKNVDQFPS
jgi:hypothetical protein